MAQSLPLRSSEATVQKECNYFNRGVPLTKKKGSIHVLKTSERMQESSKFHANQENMPNKQQMVCYYLLCSVSQCKPVIKSRQEIHLSCDLVSSAHDKQSQSCNYALVSCRHHHENAQLEGRLIPKCECLKGIHSHYQKRLQH